MLSLADKVLREVSRETTAAGVWAKLESLYMTKSLANRLYMKQRLYSYRFREDKSLLEQLDEFNKSIDDLENIDVSLGDEDKAIILLNALPKSYEQLKDAMLYGRERTITLEEVQSALKTKDLQKTSWGRQEPKAEALNINKFKGAKSKKSKQHGKKQSFQKDQDHGEKETRSCHYCKKPGHLKKNCFSWKKKMADEEAGQNTADLVEGMEQPEILNIMDTIAEAMWIVDSGCSFHMTSQKAWLEDFMPASGSVLLGNNQVCNVLSIGNII